MNKKWQIYEANVEETNRIAEKYNINKLLASIIINRKIQEKNIEVFLHPTRQNFHDPFLMPDMNIAVERILKAIENKEKAISAGRVAFKAENAEYFSVPREVDRIYFFNPFSLEILQKVIHRILESYYEKPREIKLLFYYPSDEYISYLMTVDEFMFEDEIDCRDLFPGNDMRERIVIFGL